MKEVQQGMCRRALARRVVTGTPFAGSSHAGRATVTPIHSRAVNRHGARNVATSRTRRCSSESQNVFRLRARAQCDGSVYLEVLNLQGSVNARDAGALSRVSRLHPRPSQMTNKSAFPALLFFVILAAGGALTYVLYDPVHPAEAAVVACAAFVIALIVALTVKVAAAWDRAVVLRLGKFRALRGPGVFLMVPIIDTVAYWLDTRVITTGFKAEKTLTKDTVPVDVDAVLFWKVIDPEKAALAVADYASAISWASQTALRDIIGKTMLADMLEGRDKISAQLQKIIDQRTEPWGVNVISVEVRDVLIPPSLENAMSMQAQAERERQARVILGDSERQVAEKFGEAAKTYAHDPVALHLRAMNMLYEGLKQNATIVLVPSSALETMQLGGLAGITALTAGIENARKTETVHSSSGAAAGENGAPPHTTDNARTAERSLSEEDGVGVH
jgi:regulator of protease activity HflC (stomatin/prohibitin superfamily)